MSVPSQPVKEAPRTQEVKAERNPIKRFIKILGPGLITGASDDDPSGIATYSQAGAQFGYSTLWLALFTFPLMATVQYICAKIGLVSGTGLTGVLRRHYPRWVLYVGMVLLVVANTINVGADLGAIASCMHLLVPAVPAMAAIFPVTAILVLLLVFGSYNVIAATFKWLTLSLFAYIIAAFMTHPQWGQIAYHTFVPTMRFDSEFLAVIVAVLGTTISPYLFFWQSSQEVEEERKAGQSLWERVGATKDDLKYAAVDVNLGMFFSNLVAYFIILSAGSVLYPHGITQINSAQQAAQALRPLAGAYAEILFAAGIIGTGFLAVPVLVGSSAFALAEAFGWRRGLDAKWYHAKEFYGVIAVGAAVGMEMNFFNINPMTALFWTAVINGLLAPPLLVVIMLISSNSEIMGARVNTKLVNILGWAATVVMTLAAIALLVTSI